MEYLVQELRGPQLDLATAYALKKAPSFFWNWQWLIREWEQDTTVVVPGVCYYGMDSFGEHRLVVPMVSGAYDRIQIAKAHRTTLTQFWSPSSRPEQGQPILHHARIGVVPSAFNENWVVFNEPAITGISMLEAGLRHFVRTQFGDTIDLPTKEGEAE